MQASLSRRDSTFGTNDDFGCNDDIPVGPRVGYTVGSRETTRQRLETSSSYYTPQLARRFDFLQSSFNIKEQFHKSWCIFNWLSFGNPFLHPWVTCQNFEILCTCMDAAHIVGRVLSFFSSRRNWDSPNPSPAGEFAPHLLVPGGGFHSRAGEGVGESQGDIHCGTLCINVLCDAANF